MLFLTEKYGMPSGTARSMSCLHAELHPHIMLHQTVGKPSQREWPGRKLGNVIVLSSAEEWRLVVCWRNLHRKNPLSRPVQGLKEVKQQFLWVFEYCDNGQSWACLVVGQLHEDIALQQVLQTQAGMVYLGS